MGKQMKQRIIGAVILILLAIIFLPMMLTPKQLAQTDELKREINQPKLETFVIENPNKVRDVKEVGEYQRQLVEQVVTEVDQPIVDDVVSPVPVVDDEAEARLKEKQHLREIERQQKKLEEKQPVLDEQGLPVAWSVQVASFSSKTNAAAITDKLKASEFHAYIKQGSYNNKPIWRVFIGPMSNKAAAMSETKRLAETHRLSGLVVRFVP
ncbi:DedD protein [Sinobacterium caligoides]|uniref:DedD protein n=1 Tax=Sinobacterium caligoides TaxID=933926 RepID=A0A3N2DJI9_9GAMM|nr:SPOR domain-containing protein [Sinobacterium caligoides]ROR99962.1 DedD protein [Sinobacterium caligoides]